MTNQEPFTKLFGENSTHLLSIVNSLIKNLEGNPTNYTFIPHAEFTEMLNVNVPSAMRLYWTELLGRAHFSAIASIIRSYQWSAGMAFAYTDDLFLPFSANFRSLIESAADGYDALKDIPFSLAQAKDKISQCLNGYAHFPLTAPDMESKLIHFTFARKHPKGLDIPRDHRAKEPWEYIKGLEDAFLPGISDCYSKLCQYTHPAAESVLHMLTPISENSLQLLPSSNQKKIESLKEEYQGLLMDLLTIAFNPGALILKVLLSFDTPQFHIEPLRNINFDQIQAWIQIKKVLEQA